MAKKANARRYAQAVFEIAQEQNELERWQTDLQKMSGAVSDAAFLAALDSPRIKTAAKVRFLKERLGGVSPLALNLVQLLVARSSAGLLDEIAAEYGRLLNASRGIAAAEVITAVPVDNREKQKMATRLGELVGAEIEMKTSVDPAILGGFVAHVSGKLLDGSTRSKLAALKKDLAEKN